MLRLLALSLTLGALCAPDAHAQFSSCATDGENNSTFVIQRASLNTALLPNGSQIALYNTDGTRCGGLGTWTGNTLALSVWQEDGNGNGGLQIGDSLQFKVWDTTRLHADSSVSVSYPPTGPHINCDTSAPGTYRSNALCTIGELRITTNVLPEAPTLTSPSHGAADVSIHPTLSWQALAGTTSYHVQLATDAAFTALVVDESGLTNPSLAITGLTHQIPYHWRVQATNTAGASPWSAVFTFTTDDPPLYPPETPTLTSPINTATDISVTPTLSWQAPVGTATYHLQLATDADFTALVVDQAGLTTTAYAVTGLSHQRSYYWRVQAANAAGASPWSIAFTFTTDDPPLYPPKMPTLTSPSHGATDISVAPTLSWQAPASGATYHLQLATDAAFTALVVDESGLTNPSLTLTVLTHQRSYYWRVQTTNAAGTSPWSAVFTFTTDDPPLYPPETPTLTSPINAATRNAIDPTLSWQATAGATTYHLQLATDADFTALVVDQAGLATTAYAVTGLSHQRSYYWRVQAANAAGASPWSIAFTFTTDDPPSIYLSAPRPMAPTSGAIEVSLPVRLNWTIPPSATSYRLQVKRVAANGITNVILDSLNIAGNTLKVTQLEANTTYTWQVKALAIGGESTWSNSYQFTTRADAVTANEPVNELPEAARLYGNYPNPFIGETTIVFDLMRVTSVIMTVYDLLGRPVAVPFSGTAMAGRHEVVWQAHDLPSGIYLCQLRTDDNVQTRRITLLK